MEKCLERGFILLYSFEDNYLSIFLCNKNSIIWLAILKTLFKKKKDMIEKLFVKSIQDYNNFFRKKEKEGYGKTSKFTQ